MMRFTIRFDFLLQTGIIICFFRLTYKKTMKYIVVLLMMIGVACQAQIWEDFSDENLSNDPTWQGEVNKFKISWSTAVPAEMRPALQLNSEGADTAFLSLDQGIFPGMQWEFWIKLSFNSSTSNNARIFLLSSAEDPGEAEECFFIQVGGGEDSVWFGKKDSSGEVLLYLIPGLYTGNSTNSLRLKVIKDTMGIWKFYGDATGGTSFSNLGSIGIPCEIPMNYFSIYCQFTSSNATKFYFDDIYCGPEIIDSIGPVLTKAKAAASNEILLVFDETVEENSAGNISNYVLSGGIGNPYEAFRMLDPLNVMLFFDEGMQEGVVYQLTVDRVADITGNSMKPTIMDISWYLPQPYDIIINEILADPNPQVMLPGFEYIELFNRTNQTIELDGWSLIISGNHYMLSGASIEPQGFLLLMENEALPEFKFCGPAVGFPTFSISNEDAQISLLNEAGQLICHTNYHIDKYSGSDKAEGGWSLERTDPWYPCMDEISWQASLESIGGTPGSENSILLSPEIIPEISKICCMTDSSILVGFNQMMCIESISDHSNYSADHGLGQPIRAQVTDEAAEEIILTFRGQISGETLYHLTISDKMRDCIGNPIETSLKRDFSLPSACEAFDVIFNEIMFHPLSDGAEYIELYNRSSKTIHIDELDLIYFREVPPNPPDTEYYSISQDCRPLYPEEYVVLTKAPQKVITRFSVDNHLAINKIHEFPLLNNEGGSLLLKGPGGITIDRLDYSEEMHYPLLNSYAGVSLERICQDIQCTGPDYWHSAASFSGFGTPGYVNSQYQQEFEPDNILDVKPVVFSPDGDGQDDILGISCMFSEPGMLISIWIFNENGQLARILLNAVMAGTDNTYYWDGLMDSNHPAPKGIYVILLECVSMKGYSRKYKKIAALI
jgi:hypothetical protein